MILRKVFLKLHGVFIQLNQIQANGLVFMIIEDNVLNGIMFVDIHILQQQKKKVL